MNNPNPKPVLSAFLAVVFSPRHIYYQVLPAAAAILATTWRLSIWFYTLDKNPRVRPPKDAQGEVSEFATMIEISCLFTA
jgi:hypothetical protein